MAAGPRRRPAGNFSGPSGHYWSMDCDTIRVAISTQIDGEATWLPSDVLATHLEGCPACRGTGYRGRRAIAELLVPNRAIDRLIFEGADDSAIERTAVEHGMRPIFDNGLFAVIEGDTTIEEVVRCIRSEA